VPLLPEWVSSLKKTTSAPPIPADLFAKQNNVVARLVQSDAANIDVKKSGDSYQLSKSSVKYVLCVAAGPRRGYIAVGLASPGATKDPIKPPVPKSNGNCGRPSPDPYRYMIYIRSVEAVFYYLGILLNTEQPPIPFHIYDHPVEEARFHTDYRGRSYFVREAATLANPGYCHGMAGQLDVWSTLAQYPRLADMSGRGAALAAQLLEQLGAADEPHKTRSALWSGTLGPACALALFQRGERDTLFSRQTLARIFAPQ
jgi:hypothetical protein